jgi:hypothetical protein
MLLSLTALGSDRRLFGSGCTVSSSPRQRYSGGRVCGGVLGVTNEGLNMMQGSVDWRITLSMLIAAHPHKNQTSTHRELVYIMDHRESWRGARKGVSVFPIKGGWFINCRTLYSQSTYILYEEYHSVCPLVGIGTLPTPLSPVSVPPSPQNPRTGGGGETRLRVRGWGESQLRRLE